MVKIKYIFIVILLIYLANCGSKNIKSGLYIGNDSPRGYNIAGFVIKNNIISDSYSFVSSLNFEGNDGSVTFDTQTANNSNLYSENLLEKGSYVTNSSDYLNIFTGKHSLIGSERDKILFAVKKYNLEDTSLMILAGPGSDCHPDTYIKSGEKYYIAGITAKDTFYSLFSNVTFNSVTVNYGDSVTYECSKTLLWNKCSCTFRYKEYINISAAGKIVSTADSSDSLLSSCNMADGFGFISEDTGFFVIARAFTKNSDKDSEPSIIFGLRADTEYDTVINNNLDFTAFSGYGSNQYNVYGTFFIDSDTGMTIKFFRNDTSAEFIDSGTYSVSDSLSDTGNFIYISNNGDGVLGAKIVGFINSAKDKFVFSNINSSKTLAGLALKEH